MLAEAVSDDKRALERKRGLLLWCRLDDDNQLNGGENNEAPRPTYLTKADQQRKKKQKSKAGWKVFYPRKEVGSHC